MLHVAEADNTIVSSILQANLSPDWPHGNPYAPHKVEDGQKVHHASRALHQLLGYNLT